MTSFRLTRWVSKHPFVLTFPCLTVSIFLEHNRNDGTGAKFMRKYSFFGEERALINGHENSIPPPDTTSLSSMYVYYYLAERSIFFWDTVLWQCPGRSARNAVMVVCIRRTIQGFRPPQCWSWRVSQIFLRTALIQNAYWCRITVIKQELFFCLLLIMTVYTPESEQAVLNLKDRYFKMYSRVSDMFYIGNMR